MSWTVYRVRRFWTPKPISPEHRKHVKTSCPQGQLEFKVNYCGITVNWYSWMVQSMWLAFMKPHSPPRYWKHTVQRRRHTQVQTDSTFLTCYCCNVATNTWLTNWRGRCWIKQGRDFRHSTITKSKTIIRHSMQTFSSKSGHCVFCISQDLCPIDATLRNESKCRLCTERKKADIVHSPRESELHGRLLPS